VEVKPRAPERPASPYFANAAVDWTMAGGASLVLFALFRWFRLKIDLSASSDLSLSSVPFMVSGAHFAATNYRLYRSRLTMSQYPLTAGVIPLVILAGVLGSLRWPQTIAPSFIKLYLLWSPFHYSGQTRGLSLIYARRAGFDPGPRAWTALTGFIYGSFVASVASADARTDRPDFLGLSYPSLGVSPRLAALAAGAMWACGIVFVVLVVRWCVRERRLPPAVALLPAAAQCVWFMFSAPVAAFVVLIPFFHGLQYLLPTWKMQMQERLAEDGRAPSRARLARETAVWGAGILVGYWALFRALPWLIGSLAGAPALLALAVTLAGVNIHHFFVDGVIWKLRRPRVGAALLAPLGAAGA